jgi:hypothetical protein
VESKKLVKQCEQCGHYFSGYESQHFSRQRFCSYACVGKSKAIDLDTIKKCLNCGIEFEKKPQEGISNWRKHKYCSHKCSVEHLKKQGHWRAYELRGISEIN